AMRLSKAPVIASHSSVRALANVSRNMDDELLLALKKNGGVMQTVGFASYVKVDPAERAPAIAKLREECGLPQGQRGGGGGGARGAAAGGRGGAGGARGAGNAPTPCPIEDPRNPPPARGGGDAPAAQRNADNEVLSKLSPERRAEYEKRLADID